MQNKQIDYIKKSWISWPATLSLAKQSTGLLLKWLLSRGKVGNQPGNTYEAEWVWSALSDDLYVKTRGEKWNLLEAGGYQWPLADRYKSLDRGIHKTVMLGGQGHPDHSRCI